MASKITPLYAETRILLNLWALDETLVTKSNFVPTGQPYLAALNRLVETNSLIKGKKKQWQAYSLTDEGRSKLKEGLLAQEFKLQGSVVGVKTTNAILSWFRQSQSSAEFTGGEAKQAKSNGHVEAIDSYESFADAALKTYDQLNQDYNLDDLVPIYRIRREMGDRISRQHFNEWLLKVQANEHVQLMGGDLPNVTRDQMEDSVAIPGGGTRFYVKRL